MKFFCILLLVANAAYAAWRLNREIYHSPPPAQVEVPPLPEGVPILRLLSEEEQLPEDATVAAAEPAPEPEPTVDAAAASGDAASQAAPPLDAAARSVASTQSEISAATVAESVDANAASVRASIEAQPPQEVHPPEQVAAAEPASISAPRSEPEPETPAVPADAAESVRLECVSVGPYTERGTMTAALERMKPLASRIATRSEASRQARLFQVFLEPSESEEQAKQRLEELKSKGIQDYLLIRRGEMRNAIQVGTFRSQESVAKRLAELESRGYKAVVVPKAEGPPRYWLDVAFDAQRTALRELETKAGRGVKTTTVSCDRIAAADAQP